MTASSYKTSFLSPVPVQKPPYSVQVTDAKPVEGETVPWRHYKAKNGLYTRPAEDVSTVFDLLKRSADKFGADPAVGSRKLICTHEELKKVSKVINGESQEVEKKWTYFEMSPYSYITYGEYYAWVLELASGLRKLGLKAEDRVHIFAATSAEWLAMAHACASQSMTMVTAYDTLGDAAVEHTLLQPKPKAIYIDPHLLKVVSGPLKKVTSIKYLIYNDATHQPIPDSQLEEFKNTHPDLTILPISALRSLGQSHPVDPVRPDPESLYGIMYTSGTSTTPKGVPLTHANVVAGVAGLLGSIEDCVSPSEVVLAYLPLAHIFELVVENLVLFIGATLGYGSPRTLADASMRNSVGDMRALRPTILLGVPQVWETLRKGVIAGVEAAGPAASALFWTVLRLKGFMVRHAIPGSGLLDGLVFGKVRHMCGDRLRFIVNGASGIAPATNTFLSMVLAPMLCGYGLTETGAQGAIGSPLQWDPDALGPPTCAVEVKLVSVPDLGYLTTDRPGPRGEVLIRGASVTSGYFEDPEETARALTPDGWLRTGDIGEITPEGRLRVVDRAKNVVKLLGGEYVALEKLEAVYRAGRAVQNLVICGDAAHPRPIAVVCPSEAGLREVATAAGVENFEEHAGKRDPKVLAAVLKDLQAVGREAGLVGIETISGVVLVDDEWTPASGLVTATQKLNRRALHEKYKAEIAACFGRD
ncbi:Acetyl-CoA synthetase-like protein [Pleurostoma richardsiae]|uniref:Acetyl-CoA synthetase-like protein n=1 Tax=Pleurostoma richardsiae TaxID=41990 RepID=A0AA38S614_9PEZI|nr:Acetyl-CoA synthetase-like protein [Pleurostoma richardsiae]